MPRSVGTRPDAGRPWRLLSPEAADAGTLAEVVEDARARHGDGAAPGMTLEGQTELQADDLLVRLGLEEEPRVVGVGLGELPQAREEAGE